MFSEYLGETFQLKLEPAAVVAIELIDVTGLPVQCSHMPWEKESNQEPRRAPFSLVFRGPLEPALIQRMYDIEHDKMGAINSMFFVPIGIDEKGRYYEAILN